MSLLIYGGIGSRKSPPVELAIMTRFAKVMSPYSILRSGGADGADTSFEFGAAVLGGGKHEIYLPWNGYNGRVNSAFMSEPTDNAMEIAKFYHPNWEAMSEGAQKLHGRNTHIILGPDCNSPVDLVVCWTPHGSGSGGTGQALRIAKDHSIECWDMGSPEGLELVLGTIESLEEE